MDEPVISADAHVVTWRPGQETAIDETRAAFGEADTVILKAPPGAGKSLIAKAIAQRMDARTVILTGTKALQNRYALEPTLLPIVTGRQNHTWQGVPGATAALAPCVSGYDCPRRITDVR